MLAVLKNRDYRLLWLGQAVSYMGDQFHLVALPFLVLAISHDPMQLGLVLAVAGLPRALLMLLGGAVADRVSPRFVMLASNLLRFAITAALAAAVFTDGVRMWMVYGLAAAFGIVSGFFLPAAEATVPRLLDKEQLEGGNSLMMIADQISSFVGPALAGTMIALLGGAATASLAGMRGLGAAFVVDAASFLFSTATLALMRPLPGLGGDTHPLHDIAEGLRFAAADPMIRWIVAIIALANMCMAGPLIVGVPVLAATKLPEGAAAFGLIISGYALGNLFGMLGAGALRRPSGTLIGALATALFVTFAVIWGVLAFVASTWIAVVLLVVAGLGNGYLAVTVISSLQRMTPERMIGRVMSLLMLAMFGLTPISQVLAGIGLRISLPGTFVVAAAGMLATGVLAFIKRDLWVTAEDAGAADDAGTGPRTPDEADAPGESGQPVLLGG